MNKERYLQRLIDNTHNISLPLWKLFTIAQVGISYRNWNTQVTYCSHIQSANNKFRSAAETEYFADPSNPSMRVIKHLKRAEAPSKTSYPSFSFSQMQLPTQKENSFRLWKSFYYNVILLFKTLILPKKYYFLSASSSKFLFFSAGRGRKFRRGTLRSRLTARPK